MMSVDGTHAPTEEIRPFSTKWSSHKLGGSAGLNYELGILLNKPRLAWCHGPTPAGEKNDLGVFQEELKGLVSNNLPKEPMPHVGLLEMVSTAENLTTSVQRMILTRMKLSSSRTAVYLGMKSTMDYSKNLKY